MATPRRNGQLSSCEPCRKSKLRCDHESPICGRCLSNGHSERCVYHPAPLTQPRARPFRASSRRPKRLQRPDRQLVFRLDPRISNATTAAPTPPSDSPREGKALCDQHIAQWTEKKKQTLRPGLLGLLSPQNIFGEYQDCLDDEHTGRSSARKTLSTTSRLDGKIRWFQEILELKNKISPGWFLGPPLTRALCDSMERMYDSAVCRSENTNASLLTLSRQIFINSSEGIDTHSGMNLSDYLDSISAGWETVGLVFVLLGTALFHIADDDPIFTHRNPWKVAKDQLRSISITIGELCYQFCNSAGTVNDPFCWLMTQQLVLITAMFGDSDYRVWHKLGDLSTIVYAFGLHESDEHVEESFPFFLLEIRKRVMVCAYAIDKQLATSLGRPPRICSRYCHLPLPLDLSYDEIVTRCDNGNQAMRKVDGNGWNTKGDLTVGVKIRVALLTSLLQENFLELSLSPGTQYIAARVEKLIQKVRQTQQNLPSFLRWSPEALANCRSRLTVDEGRAFAHIEFTYQEFLLHRILLKRLGTKTHGLIESSLEIITALFDMIAMQARSGTRVIYMPKDLCHMGLPAAGILTSQLLSQRSPQALPQGLDPPLPANFRSLAIQKLSVFSSHLTSLVQPEDGNFEIAQKGAKFIRWALDQTLTAELYRSDSPAAYFGLSEPWFEDCNMMDDLDFMAWCDSIHWPQDSLLGFA
ncbi:hypothetical protein BDV06DRAFT_230811 [Aspergillus oleicola]